MTTSSNPAPGYPQPPLYASRPMSHPDSYRGGGRPSDDIDLLKYLYLFLGNWHWFALALFLALGTAYIINRNTVKIYRITSSVLIEDESSNSYYTTPSISGGGDIAAGFGIYAGWYNFQNQMIILKSESLAEKTIRNIGFEVSYIKDEVWNDREVLNDVPFIVEWDSTSLQPLGLLFRVNVSGEGKISIFADSKGEKVTLYNYSNSKTEGSLPEMKIDREISWNEKVAGEGYSFTLSPKNVAVKKNGNWHFRFNSYQGLLKSWLGQLNVATINREASIINVSVTTDCPEKGEIFLNAHLKMFLNRSLDKKNQVASNTIDFIDRQLVSISDSLEFKAEALQNFRRNNQVVDLSFQAQQLYDQSTALQNQKAELKIKDDYYKYIVSYLDGRGEAGDLVAPSVMGITDPLLNNLVLEINRLLSQKVAMKGSGSGENPYLKTLDSQIRNAKATLEENTRNLINSNNLAINDIDRRLGSLMKEVSKLPQTERDLLGFERQFKLNDQIYTYLLQRRAEALIAKASNTADNEIIDAASAGPFIRPKPARNYIFAFLIGLFIPGLILVLITGMNNKVKSEDDIRKFSDLPVAGHITHSIRDYQTVVFTDPQSQVAETFRSLRNRLQFFTKETQSPAILITSSMPEEGKSFTSINLASAYSLTGRRTVLVGFDLRRPKRYTDFGLSEDKGVSTYLIGRDTLEEIIQDSGHDNLWIISSGPVPPNPSELAASSKAGELFSKLKERFDYIIIDSAPLGSVSDTFSLAAIADITILLVRHNKTLKYILENTITDAKSNGITGISLLLNDISRDKGIYGYMARYRYGYGYGYGYGYSYSNGEKS